MLMADAKDAVFGKSAADTLLSPAVDISDVSVGAPVKLCISGSAARIGRPLLKDTSSIDWKLDT
jgi:hypothetical protein